MVVEMAPSEAARSEAAERRSVGVGDVAPASIPPMWRRRRGRTATSPPVAFVERLRRFLLGSSFQLAAQLCVGSLLVSLFTFVE